jgi:hypothetical protein
LRKARWPIALIVSASVLVLVYWNWTRTSPPPVESPVARVPPVASEPAIRHPLAADPSSSELPVLGASDDAVRAALSTLWPHAQLDLFRFDNFIRRVVVTIDNLPRPELAQRLRPVVPAPGRFQAAGERGELGISPRNAARYTAYVEMAKSIDAARLVGLYVRFYPLFQHAYQELGYPNGYFNDRLIEAIDHLIAAPDLPADVTLVQPKVLYEFADRDLEQRSAGEKILMRIGNANAAVVKAKLREIRSELARRTRSH